MDAATISWMLPGDPRIEADREPLLSQLSGKGPAHFGANLGGQLRLIRAFGTTIPLLVVEAGRELSDVCSPIGRYVNYPLEEIRRRTSTLQWRMMSSAACAVRAGLTGLGIERVVYVNNWLLATNPPLRLNESQVKELTHWLAGEFPDHGILYRTVNPQLEQGFASGLLQAGCRLITTRVVHVIDPHRPGFHRHENVRRDVRLLRTTSYERSEDKTSLNEHDIRRLTALYAQLYVGRHCRHNSQFNEAFFALMMATPLIRAVLFREPESGRLDAFSLYIDNGSYLTGCHIGYDLDLPRRLGLYRMVLMDKVLLAERTGQRVNLSGGASAFKLLRGAEPVREYDAIFDAHLPRHRRLPWRLVSLEGRMFGRGPLRRARKP